VIEVMQTSAEIQFSEAMRAVDDPDTSPEVRAEMLMEIAMGLQLKPKSADQLRDAVTLYRRALTELPESAVLLQARISARMGTALQALPDGGVVALRQACECYEQGLPILQALGKPEEVAEVELNLGLATQALASQGAARMTDAIQCYHRALRVFTREVYPQEFSVLHNNLAIAYLSMPMSDERGKMREALAVQSFEEVLKVINLIDHPNEYAMIQNNLGNALQYASSSHALENNLCALDAYNEALKVRNARDTPVEYANTIANKANVLRNLPADSQLDAGKHAHELASELYHEAITLFRQFGLGDRAELLMTSLAELEQERDPTGSARLIH
jgi:tetratricopeptide (TPR) repeat protein